MSKAAPSAQRRSLTTQTGIMVLAIGGEFLLVAPIAVWLGGLISLAATAVAAGLCLTGALAALPDPHRVFVGGSGGRLEAIAGEVTRRLAPEGRIVVAAVTLETLTRAQEAFRGVGWEVSVTLVSITRTGPMGGLTGYRALNPVHLITAQKTE